MIMCTAVLLVCLVCSSHSRRAQHAKIHELADNFHRDLRSSAKSSLLACRPAAAFIFCSPRECSSSRTRASVSSLGKRGSLFFLQQPCKPATRRTSLPVLRSSSHALPRSGKRRASREEWLMLLRLTATDWPLLVGAFVSLSLAAAGEASLPALQSSVLNAALGLEAGTSSSFRVLLTQLCTLGVATSIMNGIRGFLFVMCGTRLVARLKKNVFSALLHQPQAFHDKQGVGEVSSRLATDCEKLGDALSFNVNVALRQLMQTFFAISIVLHINAQFASLVLAGVALRALWSRFYAKASRRIAKMRQDALAVSSGVAEQCMSLIKLVRTHGSEAQEAMRYGQQLERVVSLQKRHAALYGSNFFVTGILKWAMHSGVLCLGAVLVATGHLQREMLTSFVLYTAFIASHSSQVGNNLAFLEAALGAASTVFDYLVPRSLNGTTSDNGVAELPTELHEKAKKRGVIDFVDVDFAYPSRSSSRVLEKVSLSVRAGEQVAILGASGSGKSTLFAVALRLYQPTSGRLILDGKPLQEIDEQTLRSSVAWVQQEPPLFPNMTIRENIAYGLQNHPHEDIEIAAREANAYEFIQKLPKGFETRIDGTGSSLSAGQKQRVALARALVRSPALLLLDEPTSALDPESEQLVQAAIQRASKRCAVMFTTHKAAQAKFADRIIVMSQGRIAEQGNHHDLLLRNGLYARLLNASEHMT